MRIERETSRFGGFTLIEVMITCAVIAILAAIALPSYIDYVTRSKLVEAKSNLSDMRTRVEQYFLDNRSYPTGGTGGCTAYPSTMPVPAPPANTIYLPSASKYFNITCAILANTYTITATDNFSSGTHFVFTINEQNVHATISAPAGWATSATCWISRKNGDC